MDGGCFGGHTRRANYVEQRHSRWNPANNPAKAICCDREQTERKFRPSGFRFRRCDAGVDQFLFQTGTLLKADEASDWNDIASKYEFAPALTIRRPTVQMTLARMKLGVISAAYAALRWVIVIM